MQIEKPAVLERREEAHAPDRNPSNNKPAESGNTTQAAGASTAACEPVIVAGAKSEDLKAGATEKRRSLLLSDPAARSYSPDADAHTVEVEADSYRDEIFKIYTGCLASVQDKVAAATPAVSRDFLNNRYKKILKVGEGSFGEVYIVFDTETKCYLTMKRMRRTLHSQDGSFAGLHNTTAREIMLLSSLNHPHVVSLLDFHLVSDGSLVLFQPAIAHDLVALVGMWRHAGPNGEPTSGRMPIREIKCIFTQLMRGIQYLHSRKVIHRDVKASNVMVDWDGTVKIIDFGWARFIETDSSVPMSGPPCNISYRPPEILIRGPYTRYYDFSLDIWCCGCVLFEMLSGGSSFVRGHTVNEVLHSITDWLGSPSSKSTVYYGKREQQQQPSSSSADANGGKPSRSRRTKEGHDIIHIPRNLPSRLRERCYRLRFDDESIDLLGSMLCYEPSKRIHSSEVLSHPWFSQSPLACAPEELSLPDHNKYRFVERIRHRQQHHHP